MVVSLDHIKWEDAAEDLKWAVLLKLAIGKPIQKSSVEKVFSNVWRLNEPATFLKVEINIFLINFKMQEEQIRVLEGGPWTFEGTSILMQIWEPGMIGEDFVCSTLNI